MPFKVFRAPFYLVPIRLQLNACPVFDGKEHRSVVPGSYVRGRHRCSSIYWTLPASSKVSDLLIIRTSDFGILSVKWIATQSEPPARLIREWGSLKYLKDFTATAFYPNNRG